MRTSPCVSGPAPTDVTVITSPSGSFRCDASAFSGRTDGLFESEPACTSPPVGVPERTVTVTVAGAETPPAPSEAVYVNESVPAKPAAGVYVADAPDTVAWPCAPSLAIANASTCGGDSGSVAASVTCTACPLVVVADRSDAVGGWLTTVTVTVAGAEIPPAPSDALYVNASPPTKPAFGV